MSINITTLALAKAYTDKEIKKVETGGVNLDEYAKKEEIPTIQEIIEAFPKYNGEVTEV